MRQLLLLSLLILLILLGGCTTRSHHVRYVVEGSGVAIAVSYTNASGATEQRDVNGSWSASFRATSWQYVGISAFNPALEGTVSCRLYVDGVLIQRATSRGAWKTAACATLAGISSATATPAP